MILHNLFKESITIFELSLKVIINTVICDLTHFYFIFCVYTGAVSLNSLDAFVHYLI